MIIFVRHGEAAAGWGSHPDPGLSETGRSQAEAVAETLMQHKPKRILSSPMQRCQDTAAPLARSLNLETVLEPDVSEIPTPAGIADRVSWLRGLMSGDWADAPDIVLDWRHRLLQRLTQLQDDTVVFSHFVAINAIVGAVEGRVDVTVFRPDHCSMTLLRPGPGQPELVARGNEAGTRIL